MATLVEKGIIKAMIECLKIDEESIISVALQGIDNVLKCGQEHFTERTDGEKFNKFAIMAESCGLCDDLEDLQYHKSPGIYNLAT